MFFLVGMMSLGSPVSGVRVGNWVGKGVCGVQTLIHPTLVKE